MLIVKHAIMNCHSRMLFIGMRLLPTLPIPLMCPVMCQCSSTDDMPKRRIPSSARLSSYSSNMPFLISF